MELQASADQPASHVSRATQKEVALRTITPFNDDWLFLPEKVGGDVSDSAFEQVTLPHTNKIFPHHNFDNLEYQFISTYRKRFALPEPLNGRRVYVDFDGAMIASEVWLNGNKLGDHEGGYTPYTFDLTDCVRENGENLLTVYLDSTERKDIPPYGFVVDYLTFGGIYRDVRLRYLEQCHIADVFVHTKEVVTENPKLEVDIHLRNQSAEARNVTLCLTASNYMDYGVTAPDQEIVLPAYGELVTTLRFPSLDGLPIALWSLDNPSLYTLLVSVRSVEKRLDGLFVSFGFREAEFRDDGFYLNGERIKLIGLDRHQTYPYIGAAAPARLQRQDADILKYELGCNIVRTSHYPQSPYFLDRCDEIGLLVFEEIPGWQHIGDKDWQGISLRDVQAMIERDRNHPSIVLWGVRINESPDDEALYTATNALAHRLDPTRQTGGVRNFRESQFLEDVFTYNDFSNTVLVPNHTPYLITEFNGHMFPTKSWDQEERLIEHALRHARIQDRQFGMDNVGGAIGWCAFDYNTHGEFGSGDRICYHGVMDIFRLPKYAAYFYESQITPEQRIVLRAATVWSPGDRSEGGNDPLVVFSNCDEIAVFVGDYGHGRYTPDRANFPNLPHPPFQIHGLAIHATWGVEQPDLRLVGYIGGQAVVEQRISARGLPHALVLKADFTELRADGSDMTRLVFKIVDEYGNRLPYTNQVVSFEIDGPADLIGENPFALMGGQAALYVRARHELGTVTVRATTPRLEVATERIEIVR
jgi:beta-galactosidase